MTIDGFCDPRFAALRDAFAASFAADSGEPGEVGGQGEAGGPGEVGAGVCVRLDGRCVADLWGGHADAARTRPWRRDTLVNAFSVGKGVLAMLVLALVERGELELDVPLARRWPEFAAAGKGEITLRTLLAHRAGLPALRERLPAEALFDWDAVSGALARQAPWWQPDTAHGYHTNTWGFLLGELVRRATGLAVGEALASRVTGPAGADFHVGLPRREHARVADVVTPIPQVSEEHWARVYPSTGDAELDRMIWSAYNNPPGFSGAGIVNSAAWRSAQIPSANGHGSARGVAALYAAFLDGGPPGAGWPGAALRAEAVAIHSDGEDRVIRRPSRFGLGFQLAQPARPIGRSPRAFGHFGYGGSLGFADPDAGLAFGYLTNRPGERWRSPRTLRLVEALYAAL